MMCTDARQAKSFAMHACILLSCLDSKLKLKGISPVPHNKSLNRTRASSFFIDSLAAPTLNARRLIPPFGVYRFSAMKTTILLLLFVVVGFAQTKPDVPHFDKDNWTYLEASDAMRFYFNEKPATQTGKTIRAWERVELKIDTVEGQREQKRISNMTTPAW